MNLIGSYTALRNNSKAAMLAAIEIYNKPQISYRDECFSILLVNAWELLLKAILSKNKQRIYYPKKRNQPYRTLSIQDALNLAIRFFPRDIEYEPVAKNINMFLTYRNNAIHFYNQPGLSVIIYGLAQTSIVNYRDLMLSIFNIDIADEMTISLLPLSFGATPDPIEFLQRTKKDPPKNRAVAHFLKEIAESTNLLEKQNLDTGRFLTVFKVNMQSVKKISSADIIAGVTGDSNSSSPLIIERRVDPNISHPLRRKDILEKIGPTLNGIKFTTHTFEAIVWKYKLKEKANLCWRSSNGGLTRYSNELVAILKRYSKQEIEIALIEYRQYLKARLAERQKKNK